LGGKATVRESFQTDSGNLIIDVTGIRVDHPLKLETSLNMIPGVVENGIFAKVKPYKVITN
jgi:ribose 5-phosphate isomerase A